MSEISIRRVAILGAGTMGGALAAHLTNVGFSVTLLDESQMVAAEGVEHARPLLYVPERAGEIRTLSFEEGLLGLDDADWVIDALGENLQTKREFYTRMARYVRPDAIVTTCSGSLAVADLAEDLPDGFKARFMAATFASPLTDRRLVELRPGPATEPGAVRDFEVFLERHVARRVVRVKDGPGSIATRYGIGCLFLGIHVGEKLRLGIEDVDAISGPYLRRPLGVYESVDLSGIDVLRDEAASLRLSAGTDAMARIYSLPDSFPGLLARGWSGDKAGRGYYRREGKERLALDLTTMVYRQARDSNLPGLMVGDGLPVGEKIRAALGRRDEVGEFLREYLIPSLRFAEALRDEMGVTVLDFDRVMEWGFGWARGPFALIDELRLGTTTYFQSGRYWAAELGYIPIPNDEVCTRIEDCPVIERAEAYTIHDLNDGIQAVALAQGSLSPARVESLQRLFSNGAIDRFVLTAEGGDFPALDIQFVLDAFRANDTLGLDAYLRGLQRLGETLESRICVAAISGTCIGPSFGLALSCAAIVVSAEAQVGFSEARLGLVPTARSLAMLRTLHGASARKLGEVAVALSEGMVAANADLARGIGYLRHQDVTEYLPERLLTSAKEFVGSATRTARGSLPAVEGPLVGIIDRGLAERRTRGFLTEHDVAVGHRIRQALARTTTYDECLERERREFIDIGSKALSQARLRQMIETGRPLRN